MIDWEAVANEMYMFCVGVVIGRETNEKIIDRRLASLREIYRRSIEANTIPAANPEDGAPHASGE